MTIILFPDFGPEEALRIFKDPDKSLFVEIVPEGRNFNLVFKACGYGYEFRLTRSERVELVQVTSAILNWLADFAAMADPSISNIAQLRWMADIASEVEFKGRYGNDPVSDVVVVTA